MTTAIIGTGGIGSAIARQLASGGETLRLASADHESARTLAAEIGRAAVVAVDDRDALQGAGAVVLALRFSVLKGVIDQIADQLADKLVVVPSNPLSTDAKGNLIRLLPQGQSSGKVVAGWLPAGARLAMAFGTMSAGLLESSSNRSPEPAALFYATDDDRAGEEVERLIRMAGFEPAKAGGLEQSGRLEVGGDLHDLVVGPAEARSLIGRALCRKCHRTSHRRASSRADLRLLHRREEPLRVPHGRSGIRQFLDIGTGLSGSPEGGSRQRSRSG